MISSAIWDKSALVNFSKTNKLHEAVGRVQFVVFEKFTSADLSQIARENHVINYLLIIHIQNFTLRLDVKLTDVFGRLPPFLVETLRSFRGL